MKHSKAFYRRRKLLKELTYDDHKYRPSLDDCEEWFFILNEQIFNNQLPMFSKMKIGKPKRNYALFHYYPNGRRDVTGLTMTQVYHNKKMFVEVLAHEMVHLYQHLNHQPVGHGPSFRSWCERFRQKGLKLSKVYGK